MIFYGTEKSETEYEVYPLSYKTVILKICPQTDIPQQNSRNELPRKTTSKFQQPLASLVKRLFVFVHYKLCNNRKLEPLNKP